MHPPEGPPVWTALRALSPDIPPPISYTICLRVMPKGTSTRPVRLTLPTKAKVLVPLLSSVPHRANHSALFLNIRDTEARVSTLFITVGFPQRPDVAGKGGLGLGIPLLPSIDAISAVSSPQTKAPAPSFTLAWKLNPEPKMSSPSSPYPRICPMAVLILSRAKGYSARQ